MNEIRSGAEEYLALRRSLGYKLKDHDATLSSFASFMEAEGATTITEALAQRWAVLPTGAQVAHWVRRLSIVRGFAQFYSACDPATEIPRPGLLRRPRARRTPYICSDAELGSLLEAAGRIQSKWKLRARTFATAIGLLAVSGMRAGELVGIDHDDVNFQDAIITIRHGKFGKSRLVPIHPSTRDALLDYASRRDAITHHPQTTRFFQDEHGNALSYWVLHDMFNRLCCQVGIRSLSDHGGPRLHDLRHRFAVNTLLAWYRAGQDVEQQLPKLSVYLGHVQVTDTYWYLSMVPELMRSVVERLDGGPGGRHE